MYLLGQKEIPPTGGCGDIYAAPQNEYDGISAQEYAEGKFCVENHGLHAKTPLGRAGSANLPE
jgi:hypothetical protein